MISFKLLQIFLHKYNISEQVIHELLTHTKMVDSVQPLVSVFHIVESIKNDQKAESILKQDLHLFISAIKNNSNFTWLDKKIQEHIDIYGDRVLQELKLESQGLKQDPFPLYQLIYNYITTEVDLSKYLFRDNMRNTEKEIISKISQRYNKILFSRLLFITRMAVGRR